MKKNKKKKAAKKNGSLLGGAAKSLKKLGKGKATAPTLLIGAALVGLGARYLSKRRAQKKAAVPANGARNDDAVLAEFNLTSLEEEATV